MFWRREIRVLVAAWILAGTAYSQDLPGPEDRERIEAALPQEAGAKPDRPRNLLIYDANVEYGGHASIPYAKYAFQKMGETTGAFHVTVSRDPQVFQKKSLKRFDAVFFNNTVGNLFEDSLLRRNLVEFVLAGGGLMGVHGTSVAFTRWPGAVEDWPEFGRMLGARGASHLDADEVAHIQIEEPNHPVLQAFQGKDFEHRDEFFRFQAPYSRERVRVLLSMDNEKTARLQGKEAVHAFREDNDYALAWVRRYGQGRVFYCSLAHHPRVFWDPTLLRFYLDAVQFVLGDLPGPTVPSAKLTEPMRAQERLNWRLGIEAYTFHKFTFFETIEKTRDLGLAYIGGLSFQKVGEEIPKNLDLQLTDEELERIRLRLDDAGLSLLTYYYQEIPGDEQGCREVFEFGRKLGIEIFLSEPQLESLDTIERFCEEYGIKVGLHNHGPKECPAYWNPEGILKACEGRSPLIGACADVGYWIRAGIDPIEAVRTLKDRLLTIQMHDLNEVGPNAYDVPWGTGKGRTEALIREIHGLGVSPVMFGLEYSRDFLESMPAVQQCVAFFDELSLAVAKENKP